MLLYVLLIMVIILFLLYFYYKIKYPFWSRQPVFHFHNLLYWYNPPGIIQHEKPEMNKYYKSDIHFNSFDKLKENDKNDFYNFIKNNFMPNSYEYFDPSRNAIMDYFYSHNNKSFITMFYKNNFIKQDLISVMTTRPLDIFINNKCFSLYYVDYLCVHQKERKKGIAPITIYSHYVNSRFKHTNIVFLFKREGNTTSIVPLSVYKTYAYYTKYWKKNVKFDQPYIHTLKISSQNSELFVRLLEDAKKKYKCVITPYIGNLIHLINNNHLHIYVLMFKKNPVGFYIFRNLYTKYDSLDSFELTASYNQTQKEIFVLGFLNSLNEINKVIPHDIILIEDTSDNNFILNVLMKKYVPKFNSITSYYLYNYAEHPILSYELLCIN
jgi:hypothetical protein